AALKASGWRSCRAAEAAARAIPCGPSSPWPAPNTPRSCWPPPPAEPPSALASWPGWKRPPCTDCCSRTPPALPRFARAPPLAPHLVVVDDVAMLDVLLANKLVKAIPPGAHLLFVGDVDQLPSVGAGEVLRDLLAAERLPRVPLVHCVPRAL